MDFAATYTDLLRSAIDRIPEFGMTRSSLITAQPVSDSILKQAGDMLQPWWPVLTLDRPAELDEQCVILSSRIFAYLLAQGIDADIVVGSVGIKGEQVYGCSVESLKADAFNPGGEHERVGLHAWVSLGGDSIIDGTIASYLVRKFGWPHDFDRKLFVMRAGEFGEDAGIQYPPMIVGSEYIAITNPPDPLLMVTAHKQSLIR
jgi:hypothetical protein